MRKRNVKITLRMTPEEYKHFLAVKQNKKLSQTDLVLTALQALLEKDTQETESKTP